MLEGIVQARSCLRNVQARSCLREVQARSCLCRLIDHVLCRLDHA